MPYTLSVGGIGGTNANVQFGYNVSGKNYRNKTSSASLTAGDWHHVVGVGYGDGRVKIYINGVEQSLTTVEAVNYVSGEGLYIGNRQDNHQSVRFNGTIDEVKIYNRALSVEEINTFL
jgi:beta-galactosidase